MARKATPLSATASLVGKDVRFRVNPSDKWQIGRFIGLDATDSNRALIQLFDEDEDGNEAKPTSHLILKNGMFLPGVEVVVVEPPDR